MVDSDEGSSDSRSRRVLLVDGAVDADDLSKGIQQIDSSKYNIYEPGSGLDENEDESMLTEEEIGWFYFIILNVFWTTL